MLYLVSDPIIPNSALCKSSTHTFYLNTTWTPDCSFRATKPRNFRFTLPLLNNLYTNLNRNRATQKQKNMDKLEIFVYDRRKGDKPEVKLQLPRGHLNISSFRDTLSKVCLNAPCCQSDDRDYEIHFKRCSEHGLCSCIASFFHERFSVLTILGV